MRPTIRWVHGADELTIFGARVRAIRLERGLTQEELAHRADLHVNMIARLERAEVRATVTTIVKLAIGLDVLPAQVFSDFDGAAMKSLARRLIDVGRRR